MKRVLIYGTTCLLLAAGGIVAVADGHGPAVAVGVASLSSVAFILYRLIASYVRRKRAVKYVTAHGVEILPFDSEPRFFPFHYDAIELEIESVLTFWRGAYPGKTEAIEELVGKSSVEFVSRPIHYVGGDRDVIAAGLNFGHRNAVYWGPDEPFSVALTRIRHELGHGCIGAATNSWDEEAHHETFDRLNYDT